MMRSWRTPLVVAALLACAGCRDESRTGLAVQQPPVAVAPAGEDAEVSGVAPLVLGASAIDAFDYRKRAGHAAYLRARDADAAGTWPAAVTACREALTADPLHLDAAYLLAIALAKTGAEPAAILAPLTTAVSGDFIKWGIAALGHPALQSFFATPLGSAWAARVNEARPLVGATLARALLVMARGDVYGYDVETARYLRITRTGGAVVGVLRVDDTLAYITRERSKSHPKPRVGIGLVELAAGRSKKLAYLPRVPAVLRLAFDGAFVVRADTAWHAIDDAADRLALRALNKPPVVKAWLEVRGKQASERRLVTGVAADWDANQLASALRIAASKRIVTVPAAMIDGSSITWSPDRSQFAFVAVTEECKPTEHGVTIYVADAATGSTREIAHADAAAVEWSADRQLAIAVDGVVRLHPLAGERATERMPIVMAGADALITPKRTAGCSELPEPADEPPADDPEDDGIP